MKLLLLLANGFEEIEALGTLDLLRRGEVEVTTCTLNQTPLTLGAHGIAVEAELCLTELDSTAFDGVILPGGMGGSQALAATHGALELLRDYNAQSKLIAAICAAPALVLTEAGVLEGKHVTCYPAPEFIDALGEHYIAKAAHRDGNLITAAGPGCFAEFAKVILETVNPSAAKGVFEAALLPY